MGTKIMLIDDDPSMQLLIQEIIEREGWEFCCAGNGADGLEILRREKPSFLILDVMLPDMNGFDICRIIREEGRRVPIMFLSAKGDIVDKSVGFNAGADDYLVKPFGMLEMVARIRAVLRRSTPGKGAASISAGAVELDPVRHTVHAEGQPVSLTLKEYDILQLLLEHQGQVFSRDQLQEKAWGIDYAGETRTVDVHIGTLRTKLGSAGRMIVTVRGVGYKLEVPDDK